MCASDKEREKLSATTVPLNLVSATQNHYREESDAQSLRLGCLRNDNAFASVKAI